MLFEKLDPEFIEDENGCWIWQGFIDKDGYGRCNRAGMDRSSAAHRMTFARAGGVIPEGYEVDHLCRVTACVNPAHLEAVTPQENRRRRYAAMTHCKNGHAFDAKNTRVNDLGHRACRACNRIRSAAYAARKKAAA